MVTGLSEAMAEVHRVSNHKESTQGVNELLQQMASCNFVKVTIILYDISRAEFSCPQSLLRNIDYSFFNAVDRENFRNLSP